MILIKFHGGIRKDQISYLYGNAVRGTSSTQSDVT